MYKIIVTPKAEKSLDKLDSFERSKILKQFWKLELAPYHFSKKLKECDFWSLKIGKSDYRLIFEIEEVTKTVYAVAIGKRRSVYRKF